jgi:MYXO-CTERM domain-containing protein
MGLRRSGSLGIAAVLLAATAAQSAVPRSGPRVAADTLTAMPAAGLGKPLRVTRGVRFDIRQTASWQKFSTAAGGRWQVAWDPATGVPNRIWGSGIPAPGANASPQIAEQIARAMLAQHIELLAPGAHAADFELVSNHSDGDQRSVGFIQRAKGLRVVGGQVSFRFKADRLFVIGSEALPNVVVPATLRMAKQVMHDRATVDLRVQLILPTAPVTILGDEVVLPLVADDAVLGYRVAVPMQIDGGADGRYLAYVEPATGAVLAVHQQNTYASGTVMYKVTDRHPGRGYTDRPAARTRVIVGGANKTTDPQGAVTWAPDVAQSLTTSTDGDLVQIINKSTTAEPASTALTIEPGGIALWDARDNVEFDAQVTTFIATNRVKDYVRKNIDPVMPKLDEPMVANVNIAQQCNAFFDGTAINFFQSSQDCQNTGLLEDVVYHEFGHNLHHLEVIEGVGQFDGAMSEGASDFLSALITKDSGMGRGFFYSDLPLRELDPPDMEAIWPRDVGEIHKTGIIYGGTFWDLWQDLIAQKGEVVATQIVNRAFLGTLRRATSIPSSLVEALAADDDDGNLENGTPNECAIRDAFGRHGLRTATGVLVSPGAIDENASATIVRADLSGLSARCAGDEIAEIKMQWKPGFGTEPAAGSVEMTPVDASRYWAQLPLARDGAVLFKAIVKFTDGSELTLADNFPDQFYQVYQGSTVKLYCTDFETTNPFEEGWQTDSSDGNIVWQWGDAVGGATDPPVAFSGSKIIAQGLGADYPANHFSYLAMPEIDFGQYSDVRLQYRRWLAVEDSEFDKARITVDDKQVFINFTANQGTRSSAHHIDREWRFKDVGITGYGFGHTVRVQFELTTDQGLQLGGWALDDVCIVANRNSICGDGVKSKTEQCDDGPANANVPGSCRTYCRLPTCGDAVLDDGEVCDDGEAGSPTCTPQCLPLEPAESGCCSTGQGAHGAFTLASLVGLLLFRRRRR